MIYNDFDRHACAWLRELIKAGHLPEGTVDERSIKDIRGDDIRHARQWHTFAGIGGWPLALRLAGWPESLPVWTGSCPCQPYSAAGKGKGDADERNLWPDFYRLIRECRPNVVFGEQVARAIKLGWLDMVSEDLEKEGYAIGSAVLGAHSAGLPHIRKRLYWVAYANSDQHSRIRSPRPEDASYRNESNQKVLQERERGFDQLVAMGLTERVSTYSEALRTLDGIPGRVGLLRGYGNAIVPQVAAAFITAFMQSMGIQREGAQHV